MHLHYDLIVIGSDPAGKRAAIQAAKVGKDVLLVEKTRLSVASPCTPEPSRVKPCAKPCYFCPAGVSAVLLTKSVSRVFEKPRAGRSWAYARAC